MKKKQDSFSQFLIISLGLHVLVAVLLTVKIYLFPTENLDYQQSVRVDVVALPEKIKEPPKSEPAQPKVAKAEKPKPQTKPKKKKKKKPKKKKTPIAKIEKKKVEEEQSDAIKRLEALNKIKKSKANPKPTEFKGNALNLGDSLEGLPKLQHNSYMSDLQNKIKEHWNLPEWLANDNLNAIVVLKINRRGAVIAKNFQEKSGNSVFDDYVMGTIEKATPLPPPPSDLISIYSEVGIGLRFP